MIKALLNNNICYAHLSKKLIGYKCPVCLEDVILKKGNIKIDHFAHKARNECINNISESQLHLQSKINIFNTLKNNPLIQKLEMERYLKNVIPDVSFIYRNIPIAIEIQHSTIPIEIIEDRMKYYKEKGIYVLWVLPDKPQVIHDNRYSPKKWERYLHGLYYGNLFFLNKNCTISAYKLEPYLLSKDCSEWYESGEEMSSDGYNYYSKRYRTLTIKKHGMDLINNFRPIKKPKWNDYPSVFIWGGVI